MTQQHGRGVPPALTHTFPNGAVATVRQVSQFTIASLEIGLAKKHPRPAPPMAPGVDGALEPNPADPDHAAAVQRWEGEQQLRMTDALLQLCVEVDVDAAALADVRATFDVIGVALEEISDKVAYIKHCCVRDIAADLAPLAALIRGNIPTEADVQAHVETFPGDVGGAGSAHGVRPAVEGAL